MMSEEIHLYAKHYFNLGLNVTCIGERINEYNFYYRNLLKSPNHAYYHLYKNRQTDDELNSYDWSNAVGVGCASGFNNLTVIDIDGCNDYLFLEEVLQKLKLPKYYEWVVESGSKNGFHIYIFCEKFNFLNEKQVVTILPPKDEYIDRFCKIEVLWQTNVVLPPSIHKSGSHYSFTNCKIPRKTPLFCGSQNLHDFFHFYTKFDPKKAQSTESYGEYLFKFINANNLNENFEEVDLQKYKGTPLICVLDIETDGLIVKHSHLNTETYPNVLQIAWIIIDRDFNIYKKVTELINGPSLTKTDAYEINNINLDTVRKFGKLSNNVFRSLARDLDCVKYIVAHNADFDISILNFQFKKHQMSDPFRGKTIICTMRESTIFCDVRDSSGRRKFPKLVELYKKLFDRIIEQKHDAEGDVLITTKCFRELVIQNVIKL